MSAHLVFKIKCVKRIRSDILAIVPKASAATHPVCC